jgi:hypothetical protein
LSGVGDAEIQASTGFAKMCGYLQAISVQIYLAVVIARVVGMHSGDEARQDRAKAALSEHG